MKAECPLVARWRVDQHYADYTFAEHKTWQSTIACLGRTLRESAHPDHGRGMALFELASKTIPRIGSLSEKLGQLGWRAVCVDGFMPPQAFMSLQAKRVLPISRAIRSRRDAAYTPAPDIIHEVAGHVPMLVNPHYRRLLARLGELGAWAEESPLDRCAFRLQRALSDAMAVPRSEQDAGRVQELRDRLERLRTTMRDAPLSPATAVARLHWWTVEYGLIGATASIYGAGILSSAAESADVARGKKIALSADCVRDDYDITTVQPRYYVADNWAHLDAVATEVEGRYLK